MLSIPKWNLTASKHALFWHHEHTLCVWQKSVITRDVKNNVCSWLLNMSEEPIERDCYKNLPNTKYWYLSRWNRWNANRYSLYLCIYVDLVPQPCSISYYVARCFVLYQITSVFCFNLRGCIGGHMVALCDQFQCLTDIFQLQLGFDSCPSSNEPVDKVRGLCISLLSSSFALTPATVRLYPNLDFSWKGDANFNISWVWSKDHQKPEIYD